MIKKVKIITLDYDVEMVPRLENESGNELYGWHQEYNQRILISEEYTEELQVRAIWHEVCHGLFRQFGMETDDEEEICRALGHMLPTLLRDNPELVKLTMGDAVP
ncbi:hypothetical protein G4Y79_15365 [Phototrophicus methaneseepsis]|uniref:IrrE N-terminal-like domain-containing protein n=1 Tax=Phototrophicus methaneseepsis TaxID=2710758 RepID=A0A7S8E652_9CHLR|nr:hypothetical protein [Phototrophicus methaneseepsis]QPC81082.1 hypothetical protein G4Y79_15365 [Phototrophicus methaneseepsis]